MLIVMLNVTGSVDYYCLRLGTVSSSIGFSLSVSGAGALVERTAGIDCCSHDRQRTLFKLRTSDDVPVPNPRIN